MSTAPANRRWITIALAVSIALNLFLGGLVAGRFTGQVAQGAQAKRSLDAALAPLPEDKRAVVRRELRKVMPEIRRDLQATQRARAALAEEFGRAEPDATAIDRHFREVQTRTTAMQDALQQAFKRAATNLTVEERRVLIEAAKRRAPRAAVPDL